MVTLFNFAYPTQVLAANMIANPGFENGLWTERTSGWTLDTISYFDGLQSAKITGAATEQYMTTPSIATDFYDRFELSVWIKTTSVSPNR